MTIVGPNRSSSMSWSPRAVAAGTAGMLGLGGFDVLGGATAARAVACGAIVALVADVVGTTRAMRRVQIVATPSASYAASGEPCPLRIDVTGPRREFLLRSDDAFEPRWHRIAAPLQGAKLATQAYLRGSYDTLRFACEIDGWGVTGQLNLWAPLATVLEIGPRPIPRAPVEPLLSAVAAAVGDSVVRRGATPDSVRSVRDYQPGDGPTRVHWPQVARHGRLIVKEFEPVGDDTVIDLLVDLGPNHDEVSEAVASDAAAIGARLLGRGWRVEVVSKEQAGPTRGRVDDETGLGRCLARAVPGDGWDVTSVHRVTVLVGPDGAAVLRPTGSSGP